MQLLLLNFNEVTNLLNKNITLCIITALGVIVTGVFAYLNYQLKKESEIDKQHFLLKEKKYQAENKTLTEKLEKDNVKKKIIDTVYKVKLSNMMNDCQQGIDYFKTITKVILYFEDTERYDFLLRSLFNDFENKNKRNFQKLQQNYLRIKDEIKILKLLNIDQLNEIEENLRISTETTLEEIKEFIDVLKRAENKEIILSASTVNKGLEKLDHLVKLEDNILEEISKNFNLI